MGEIVFIGDELTAAGFRLTGIRTRTPRSADVAAVLTEERAMAGLVLITAELAAHVSPQVLDDALSADPPCAVLPDARAVNSPPDLTAAIRAALGIET